MKKSNNMNGGNNISQQAATDLRLPLTTPFPVQVTNLLKQVGDEVGKHEAILRYKYKGFVNEDTEEGTQRRIEKEFHLEFESPLEGIIDKWNVKIGDTINDSRKLVASVMEPCSHPVQYGGMCAMCGKILGSSDYSGFNDLNRAPIMMAHETKGLSVSLSEARRIEANTASQLLAARKLILVVDLDQTVIHTTVDPTVGDWMQDPTNPNFGPLKDVQSFQLDDEATIGQTGQTTTVKTRYYVKTRPGLSDFLEKASKLFELHVYTMATRAYAKAIADIIDPDGKYFADRILSRDESGSLTLKSLKRLFPVDTSMVVVIDDRGDVWEWSPNLVKVIPYEFFLGIGDINSSFLPKRQDTPTLASVREAATTPSAPSLPSPESSDSKTIPASSSLDQGSINDETQDMTEQASMFRAELESQQHERPLAKQQDILDSQSEDDEEPTGNENNKQDDDSKNPKEDEVQHNPHHHRHKLLSDNDAELDSLGKVLSRIHDRFYAEYDEDYGGDNENKRRQSVIQQQRPNPEIDIVMSSMKFQVLKGTSIVFSGVIRLGTCLYSADIVKWAKSFGSQIVPDLNENVTHLVAMRSGTQKVYEARTKYPNIKVVSLAWLLCSFSEWRRMPEGNFLFPDEPNIKAINDNDDDDDNNITESPRAMTDSTATINGVDETPSSEEEEESIKKNTVEKIRRASIVGGALDWKDMDREIDEFMGISSESSSETGDESSSDSQEGDDDDDRQGKKRKISSSQEPESGLLDTVDNSTKRAKQSENQHDNNGDNDDDDDDRGNQTDSSFGDEFAEELEAELA